MKNKSEENMSESDEEFNDENLWETELEIALLTKCDYGTIRSITKLRPIPENLRTKVWKVGDDFVVVFGSICQCLLNI